MQSPAWTLGASSPRSLPVLTPAGAWTPRPKPNVIMQPPALTLCGASSPRLAPVLTPHGAAPGYSGGEWTPRGDGFCEIPQEGGSSLMGQAPHPVHHEDSVSALRAHFSCSDLHHTMLQQIANSIAKDVAQKANELMDLASGLPSRFHCSSFPLQRQPKSVDPLHEGNTGHVAEQDSESDSGSCSQVLVEKTHAMVTNEFTPVKYIANKSRSRIGSICVSSIHDHNFELKPEWERNVSRKDVEQARAKSRLIESNISFGRDERASSRSVKSCGFCVVSPTRPPRLAWEVLGMTFITYDLIYIPLLLTFALPASIFTDIIDWITLLFWTANIPVSMLTGFFARGMLVLDARRALLHYLKTWFLVDIFIAVNDWLLTISRMTAEDDDHASGARLLQLLRFMRVTRLLRLLKLSQVWDLIHDFTFGSETAGIVMEVMKMLLVLMLVIHFTACIWYLIGDSDARENWIKFHGFTSREVGWTQQYAVAYHWSLTQFTPSSMHVQPQNRNERIFAIFVVLCGLVGFSYLVGSINLSLGRLRVLGEQKSKKFRQLRHFLQQNKIPLDLGTRIRNYAEGRWDDQHRDAKEANVTLLHLLSEHLKSELAWALRGNYLHTHPLFNMLETSSFVTMRRMAFKGMSQLSMAPGDILFVAGEMATHMSMLASGEMNYFRVDAEAPEVVGSFASVIAEPVMWTVDWQHCGDLSSNVSTELLMMDPEALKQIATQSPVAFQTVKVYARGYVQMLNEFERSSISDIITNEVVMSSMQCFAEASNLVADHAATGLHNSAARNKLMDFLFAGAGNIREASVSRLKKLASMQFHEDGK